MCCVIDDCWKYPYGHLSGGLAFGVKNPSWSSYKKACCPSFPKTSVLREFAWSSFHSCHRRLTGCHSAGIGCKEPLHRPFTPFTNEKSHLPPSRHRSLSVFVKVVWNASKHLPEALDGLTERCRCVNRSTLCGTLFPHNVAGSFHILWNAPSTICGKTNGWARDA